MSETDYKEAPFSPEEAAVDIPVKVHIIAPSTLPEGYVFEAQVGAPGSKKTISVEVVSAFFNLPSREYLKCVSRHQYAAYLLLPAILRLLV